MAVAISWSAYFVSLLKNFHIYIPSYFLKPFNFPAFLIVIFITFLLILGIKESAKFNNFLVILKVSILLFFIFVGIFHIKPQNYQPFMPNGFSGTLTGAGLIFFAYIGFDAISTLSEETKNPKKHLPISIILSLFISTIIYILVAFVLIGISNYKNLNTADPLSKALNEINLNWASSILAIGALISTTTVLLTFQAGQPRIFFAMARDKFIPKFFSYIHSKFKTPFISIIICGLIVGIFSAISDISVVAELTNIGTLFTFFIINLGVLYLRIKKEINPPFKTPLFPTFQILGAICCLILMLSLPKITWIRFIIWLIVGIVIYFIGLALRRFVVQ